jgi:hypothetical protein
METRIQCPACGVTTALDPSGAGEGWRCPACSADLPGPPDERITQRRRPKAAALPAVGERPAPPLAPAWGAVGAGLELIHTGLLVGFLGAVAAAVVEVLPLFREPAGAPAADSWLGLLLPASGLAFVVCWLLTLVGQCVGCAAPTKSGAGGWAAGAAVANLMIVLLGGLAVVLLAGALSAAGAPDSKGLGAPAGAADGLLVIVAAVWLALGSGLAGLAEVACTVLFLRAVAGFFNRPSLAQRLGHYLRFFLTFLVVLLVVSVGAGLLLGLAPGDPATKLRVLPFLLVVGLVCFLILYAELIGLVKETRDAVVGRRGPG